MQTLKTCAASLGLAVCLAASAQAGQTFALVSKSLDDPNFADTAQGCQEAARQQGDQCLHLGPAGPANARRQATALEQALQSRRFAAMAVSVVNSSALGEVVRKSAPVPLITFDSPFARKEAALSQSYVGTDNLAFGRDLARLARQQRPQGGSICMMGDLHDPNLALRMHAVRQELSGDAAFPEGRRLNGEAGWTEPARCPWSSGDESHRALGELSITLQDIRPDVFLAVGHWPLVDPAAYRKAVTPFRKAVTGHEPVIIVGVGRVTPELQALLKERLVHGLVSINFPELGRRSYQVMRALANGAPVPAISHIPNTIWLEGGAKKPQPPAK